MSEFTQTVAARLAAALNHVDESAGASERRVSRAQLVARIHNAVSSGPDLSHKTTTFAALLAATRNALTDDPDKSSLTTPVKILLNEVLTLANLFGGTPGEGAGELWFADFRNGVYRVAGDAATVGDVVVEETDWDSFDPEVNIVPGTGLTGGPGVHRDLVAVSPLAFTIIGTLYCATDALGQNLSFRIIDLPAYNIEVGVSAAVHADQTKIAATPINLAAGGVTNEPAVVGVHKLGMTVSPTEIAFCLDGGPVVTKAFDPDGITPNSIIINCDGVCREVYGHSAMTEAELIAATAVS